MMSAKGLRRVLAFVFAALVGAAGADTLTWSGGSSGDISDAANWGGTEPATGDTLTFTKAVTLTGSFDFDEDGVTLDCQATVTSSVAFSGAGVLHKTGAGQLQLTAASTYAGGTWISEGSVQVTSATGAGTGTITVDRTTEGSSTYVEFKNNTSTTMTFANPIKVEGTYVNVDYGTSRTEAAAASNASVIRSALGYCLLNGAVTGDGSISILANGGSTSALTFGNTVTVPAGEKIIVDVKKGGTSCYFKKAVYGSLARYATDQDSWTAMTLYAASGRAGETLTTHTGNFNIKESASWAGSTIVVTNLATTLNWSPVLYVYNTSRPFAADATLYASSKKSYRNKPLIYNNTKGQRLKALYFDDVLQPDGTYVTGDLGGCLTNTTGTTGSFVVNASNRQWKGGSSGVISDPANWGGTLPSAGDTLIFYSATTLTGSLDIGSGLTIDCQAKVTSQASFTGSGLLTKIGSGELVLAGASTYSGGTWVSEQCVTVESPTGAGTGTITVDRTTSGSTGYVKFDSSSAAQTYANAIHVKGTYVNTTIGSSYSVAAKAASASPIQVVTPNTASTICTFTGAITGDGSIALRVSNSRTADFCGTVTVPEGEKIIVAVDSGGTGCRFRNTVSGSLVKYGSSYQAWNTMTLLAAAGRAGDSLTTHTGPIYFSGAGAWAGSTVVATNLTTGYYYAPCLTIQGTKAPLSSAATVHFSSRAVASASLPTLTVPVQQYIKALYFDGVRQADGVYTAGDLEGHLTGAGSLIVGDVSAYTWIGGASGRWSEATNWDPTGVPGAGSTVYFTNIVKTAKETVDIGEEGITIASSVNYSNSRGYANLSNDFVGAGAITKIGIGTVQLYGTSTYAGMTRIRNGGINVNGCNSILPNPVTLYSESGTSPQFGSDKAITYTNDVYIVGTAGSPSFLNSNSPHSYGNIFSEDDFQISCSWAGGEKNPTRIYGAISAPGRTITVSGFNSTDATRFYSVTSTEFNNDVNASINKSAYAAPMIFANGTIGSRSEKLTIQGGTNIVRAAAHMAFTNIVLKAGTDGAYCSIRLDAASCVEEDAEFRLTTATVSITVKTGVTEKWTITPKIVVPKDVRARVGRVIVDGVDLEKGVYQAGEYEWLGGEGRLIIGSKRGFRLIGR